MSVSLSASRAMAFFAAWLLDARRASYGLALMRIAFGGMTLVILAMYLPNISYTFGAASRWGEALAARSTVNSYLWPLPFPFSRGESDFALYLNVAILMAVSAAYMLGWRMRIISPVFVYLWLGFTTLNPSITNSGHYQTFRIMIIILLFADLSHRWSLDSRRRRLSGKRVATGRIFNRPSTKWVPVLFNNVAVILIGYQLCVIYITSALWKLQGSTWLSGVAVYYPLRLEELTLFPWLNSLVWHMTPVVYLATWASVYLQLLFPFMLLNRWTRIFGLIAITGMHAGIGVLLALPFFSLMMIAGDMLFIRETTWAKVRQFCRDRSERVMNFARERIARFRDRGESTSPSEPTAAKPTEAPVTTV